ncbi:hypothetical protein DFAR_710010 [Desulfarculales bacterium]
MMIAYTGLICWLTYGYGNVNWLIILFSLLNFYYALHAARLASGAMAARLGSRNWQLITTLIGYGTFFIMRAVLTSSYGSNNSQTSWLPAPCRRSPFWFLSLATSLPSPVWSS